MDSTAPPTAAAAPAAAPTTAAHTTAALQFPKSWIRRRYVTPLLRLTKDTMTNIFKSDATTEVTAALAEILHDIVNANLSAPNVASMNYECVEGDNGKQNILWWDKTLRQFGVVCRGKHMEPYDRFKAFATTTTIETFKDDAYKNFFTTTWASFNDHMNVLEAGDGDGDAAVENILALKSTAAMKQLEAAAKEDDNDDDVVRQGKIKEHIATAADAVEPSTDATASERKVLPMTVASDFGSTTWEADSEVEKRRFLNPMNTFTNTDNNKSCCCFNMLAKNAKDDGVPMLLMADEIDYLDFVRFLTAEKTGNLAYALMSLSGARHYAFANLFDAHVAAERDHELV